MPNSIWKTIYNVSVIVLLLVAAGFYVHSFEQWLLERALSSLNIEEFSSYATLEIANWLPTILVGFLLAFAIHFLTFGAGKIRWILFSALVLTLLSFIDRQSYWYSEPLISWYLLVEARHFMYLIGALIAVFTIQKFSNKITK